MNVQVHREERDFTVTREVSVAYVHLEPNEIQKILVDHMVREQGLDQTDVSSSKMSSDTGYDGGFYGVDLEILLNA